MKLFLCLGFILLLTTQLYAEIYSWIDDGGTYNYTEDYSSVPKKYQKKVKRREDLRQDVKPQVSSEPKSIPGQTEKVDTKSAEVSGDEKGLYGGKSRAAWRKEMDVLEAELSSIEQHMERLKKQISDPNGISKDQFEVLKKDYKDSRATYDQKYKNYTELIETVRKAGISVEIKK